MEKVYYMSTSHADIMLLRKTELEHKNVFN